MNKTTLSLDELEVRAAPVVAIEYLFLAYQPPAHVARPSPAFAGVKVELPTPSLGQLVGWPPIKVGR